MSLSTINDAVRELERRGILRSVKGVGIYVAKVPAERLNAKLGLLSRDSSQSHPYRIELMKGVRQEGARHNLEVVLFDDDKNAIKHANLDAVLLYCHESEALALNLPEGLPQVLLFQHSSNFTCVVPDDLEGAKLATQHLLSLGHRRIAFLPSSDYDSISCQRLSGYLAAHQEAGITVDQNQVKILTKTRVQSYHKAGELTMESWLKEGWQKLDCTAIVVHMVMSNGSSLK